MIGKPSVFEQVCEEINERRSAYEADGKTIMFFGQG